MSFFFPLVLVLLQLDKKKSSWMRKKGMGSLGNCVSRSWQTIAIWSCVWTSIQAAVSRRRLRIFRLEFSLGALILSLNNTNSFSFAWLWHRFKQMDARNDQPKWYRVYPAKSTFSSHFFYIPFTGSQLPIEAMHNWLHPQFDYQRSSRRVERKENSSLSHRVNRILEICWRPQALL